MIARSLPLILALAAAGCDLSKHDMGDQPKAETYAAEPRFADGTSVRPLVAGVVSRDPATVGGLGNLQRGPVGPAGGEASLPLDFASPLPVNRETVERGQRAFEISCAPCHGRLGNGDGMIVQRGLTRPPSFHVARLRDVPDAHFYNVITNGYGAMFPYNDRVAPEDRWAIVAYVRALQTAPDLIADGEATRTALVAGGDPNAPKAGTP